MREPEPLLTNRLADLSIVFVAGAGGVGKTTTSAAIAVGTAMAEPKSVLVLTIDPARRLANAMGLDGLPNAPTRVDLQGAKGTLFAAMVDMKASWDEMIYRCAPDEATTARIINNPIYQSISTKFVQSHDYIAVEALYEFYQKGSFDLIVVDTPPSRNAIDFLDAPRKMEEFFASKLLRWLTIPRKSRLVTSAFKPFYLVAERILGSAFVKDISEFFFDFQQLYEGFVQRAATVNSLVESEKAGFVVVTTPEEIPTTEAIHLLAELRKRRLNLAALIMNRSLPEEIFSREADELADSIANQVENVIDEVLIATDLNEDAEDVGIGSARQLAARVLIEMANSYEGLKNQKSMESLQLSRLPVADSRVFTSSQLECDISSISNLIRLSSNMSVRQ